MLTGTIIDLLVTPTAQLAVNGGSQDPAKRRAGGHGPTLADQVENLPGGMTIEGEGWGKYQAAVERWAVLFGDYPNPVEPGRGGKPRLAAPFPEWMMGMPAGWVTGIPGLMRTHHLRLIGNGVVRQQAVYAIRLLLAAILFPGGVVAEKSTEEVITEEVILVTSANGMDTKTFAKHFTKRHPQYLAGQVSLPGSIARTVADSYRAYHRRLHEISELEHVHESD